MRSFLTSCGPQQGVIRNEPLCLPTTSPQKLNRFPTKTDQFPTNTRRSYPLRKASEPIPRPQRPDATPQNALPPFRRRFCAPTLSRPKKANLVTCSFNALICLYTRTPLAKPSSKRGYCLPRREMLLDGRYSRTPHRKNSGIAPESAPRTRYPHLRFGFEASLRVDHDHKSRKSLVQLVRTSLCTRRVAPKPNRKRGYRPGRRQTGSPTGKMTI